MTDKSAIDSLLRQLYAARVRGDLDAVCATFTDDAHFQVAGASYSKPIAITASGVSEFRPWLALMIKTFRLSNLEILSIVVDGSKAAVHWRVQIHSRITGVPVLTELIDMIGIRDGRIASYVEFFVPR